MKAASCLPGAPYHPHCCFAPSKQVLIWKSVMCKQSTPQGALAWGKSAFSETCWDSNGGIHHPAQEHEAPPALTPSQEPPCRAGETQAKQAVPQCRHTHIWSWRPHRSWWSLSNGSMEREVPRAASPTHAILHQNLAKQWRV